MRTFWRTLPRLALPAAMGLGVAYLATSFVPRPAPTLRPPEELRAKGLGYAEESPVRAVLERNVLSLESTPFTPPGPSALSEPPAPVVVKAQAGKPGQTGPAGQPAKPQPRPPQAGFAPLEPSVAPSGPGLVLASPPLSGGTRVKGLTVAPDKTVRPGQPGQVVQIQPDEAAPARHAQPRPAPAAHSGLEGFRLVGVIAGGERPVAMLQVDGQAVSLRPGEAARGWTLMSVEPGQVVLRRGQDVRRLPLGAK